MGFIQAVKGSIGGSLADQWKDFYGPKSNVSATAGVFPGVPMGTNNGRGANYKGNENIITNGSKIVVPEGTALVTIQDGAITGIITEAGGYEYTNDNPNAKSIFAGDSPVDALVKQSWERFKFGGVPGTQQLIFYVNMKEIPNNRFGTQSEIYWDDAYFGTQVGAVTRGTYTLKIADPILFIKNFVPVVFVSPGAPEFDFADMDNPAGEQLFNEVVGSLSAAFSNYTNDPSKGNRMSRIQGDQIGFAQAGVQWHNLGLTACACFATTGGDVLADWSALGVFSVCHCLLTRLSDLATDLLAFVANTLALIRIVLTQTTDISGDLSD